MACSLRNLNTIFGRTQLRTEEFKFYIDFLYQLTYDINSNSKEDSVTHDQINFT